MPVGDRLGLSLCGWAGFPRVGKPVDFGARMPGLMSQLSWALLAEWPGVSGSRIFPW